MTRTWRITGLIAVGVALVAFGASLFVPLDRELFSPARTLSLRITDRHGTLLREVLSEREGRGRWCSLAEISPHVVNAVIATEDARFFQHPGVDPLALLRAAWQNARARRIVSGGSTISMQVIRNVYPAKRTLAAKLREAWLALRLERMMKKEDILLQYLNSVPFGNQVFGVDAAARLYFGKPPAQLSAAEAAFLAALPNSPTLNDPYRNIRRARERQRHILLRMEEEGFLSKEERERAEQEALVLAPRSASFKAPHFTTMILQNLPPAQRPGLEEIRTTLDETLQRTAELMVQAHLARLRKHDVTNAALVVIDNVSHELLALVGSKDFFDTTINGQVNGALALRQPGSTIKPFTYGIALEHGMTAADILPDIPLPQGATDVDFLPENYDRKYHGPVRLRTALACSYNVPAVRTLERFGEELLLRRLHAAGIVSLNKPSSYYGSGLTLGNGEVSLLELVNAYSALANSGMYVPLRFIRAVRWTGGAPVEGSIVDALMPPGMQRDSTRVFSPQVAYLLTDILSDAQARAPAFGANSSLTLPFRCAVKTGTSKDYRDNWAVGYTPRYTVGVWVGNFSGTPMKLVSGITGAAPLFRDMMIHLHRADQRQPQFVEPPGLLVQRICPRSGMKPGKACPGEITELFLAGTEPKQTCTVHRKFRLDARDGLLATAATPQEFVIEKVFEIFPPLFDRWMEQEGIPMPPTRVSAATNATQTPLPHGALAITSPSMGDVFRLDPILRPRYQTIPVESVVPSDVHEVRLCVNGKEIASLAPPYRYRLPLASLPKGSLTLVVKAKKGTRLIESEPVRIAVQ
jgi:penicillin-binding protein 1C